MKEKRLYKYNDIPLTKKGPVIYWMSRDQRVDFNHALSYAQSIALELKIPLIVVFCLADNFMHATLRQYDFMLNGLLDIETKLKNKNLIFTLLMGNPEEELLKYVDKINSSLVLTDFDPLKIKMKWKYKIAGKIKVPFYEIDAHNIVPCRLVSSKREYAAYTLRPKINKLIDDFINDIPENVINHPYKYEIPANSILHKEEILRILKVNNDVSVIKNILSGEENAQIVLNSFMNEKIEYYDDKKNDPTLNYTSGLSPFIHFGQISSQYIALKIINSNVNPQAKKVFLDELVVRKELSDNFCLYCDDYDNINALYPWARNTLYEHRNDEREYVYSFDEFEKAATHDPLWNSAQIEMVNKGKMHGYMRMYWAKKILEWSISPDEAIKTSIILNNKYSLDGNDPNAYAGIMWSIGGVHDRAWGERPVFGKIRYMSYNGCKTKFDIKKYIEQNKLC